MFCSLKDLYRIGPGPSSSHTIGPYRICLAFLNELDKKMDYHFEVTLYGSLALTGKGHLTDKIIKDTLKNCNVIFDYNSKVEFPNTMTLKAYLNEKLIKEATYYSIGGGQIEKKGGESENDNLFIHFLLLKK